jgi:hypothetical protein
MPPGPSPEEAMIILSPAISLSNTPRDSLKILDADCPDDIEPISEFCVPVWEEPALGGSEDAIPDVVPD